MDASHQNVAHTNDQSDEAYNDFTPIFYVGQHESKRALPITARTLRQAQDVGYDMLTTPITTPYFHSRVLTVLSNHIAALESMDDSTEKHVNPTPILPPLTPVDTPLSPGDTVTHLIGYCSPWIDLSSPDPVISNLSRQVLTMEVAYAAFCGLGNIILPGPNNFNTNCGTTNGIAQYARAVQEALNVGIYVHMAIYLPMHPGVSPHIKPTVGELGTFARQASPTETDEAGTDLYATWDAWNVIRTICKYNTRLSVALALPPRLSPDSLQSRWFAEPLRILSFAAHTFVKNKGGHPVLTKAHQNLISRYMRLKHVPWLLLCDVGPIPGLDDPNLFIDSANGFPSPSAVVDAGQTPTPAEAAELTEKEKSKSHARSKEVAAHLIYIRWLQRHQPPRDMVEKFGSGYQDYLQAPLQPLADNLESVTYEVFEKDPVKYDQYEEAIAQALADWAQLRKPTSSASGAVVVAVAGSGRGPLVTRALRASAKTGVPIEPWAIEKNPNAYVLLLRHNEEDWNGAVNVVKSDMRAWKGPVLSRNKEGAKHDEKSGTIHGKVDILVSELLGSFADNELSPECLDGVQHVLADKHGISIPSSYTAHLTPIAAPRLHAEISQRGMTDPTSTETPYVVMLHQVEYVATSVPDSPRFQQAWEFSHPIPASTLQLAEARRSGGVSGGGGGSMAGGDGANEHNVRAANLKFVCRDRGVIHGIAGYFESVLYNGGAGNITELSTRPDTIDTKSRDMISWFPIYFPLKNPLYFPDDTELEVRIWRQTDDRKVWYEWLVEAFMVVGPGRRVRIGLSETGSSRKNGCLM